MVTKRRSLKDSRVYWRSCLQTLRHCDATLRDKLSDDEHEARVQVMELASAMLDAIGYQQGFESSITDLLDEYQTDE